MSGGVGASPAGDRAADQGWRLPVLADTPLRSGSSSLSCQVGGENRDKDEHKQDCAADDTEKGFSARIPKYNALPVPQQG
jgi:hypothetical protein